ncbi:4-hydroxythreonine-4-phosphate dehydrogenase PdxA [Aerococcus urinaeequi]|uniref:4-hydroxythreonine-4-phosphate dehydrogenase PdxA n=1 Tax=Aerococcus urinaeequi TaxID=51665 RepID=UPI0039BD6328
MEYVGISMGDPAGIGPEIALKSLIDNEDYRSQSIIFGSKGILLDTISNLSTEIKLNEINDIDQFQEGKINFVNVVDLDYNDLSIGEESARGGDAAFKYVSESIEWAMDGKTYGVVTCPLNKKTMHMAGHKFAGHTEIFAEKTGTKKYTMMLWSENLAVVHVSTHVALREACDLVKKERVVECIDLANNAMKSIGISEPRIAVAGLNPHSGESGLFGSEDDLEIKPAVQVALDKGLNVEGPISPDTVFLKASKGAYDIVVAMYHDQGHIPMKLLAFDDGVNITLGLPIIRTSVDHGTAFDIAGKGVANPTSLLWSIKLAIDMHQN